MFRKLFRVLAAVMPLAIIVVLTAGFWALCMIAPAFAQAAAAAPDMAGLLSILGAAGPAAIIAYALASLAASILVAVTPTPAHDSVWSRPYQLLEWLAVVTRSTKETGIPAVDALHAAQLAVLGSIAAATPAATAVTDTVKAAAPVVAALLFALFLASCAALGLTGDPANDLPIISKDVLATVNAACADYAPVGALAVLVPDPKVQSIALMTNGVCDVATGTVVPGAVAKLDASSAAWVGLSVGMLKALGVQPVAAPAAAPAKAA